MLLNSTSATRCCIYSITKKQESRVEGTLWTGCLSTSRSHLPRLECCPPRRNDTVSRLGLVASTYIFTGYPFYKSYDSVVHGPARLAEYNSHLVLYLSMHNDPQTCGIMVCSFVERVPPLIDILGIFIPASAGDEGFGSKSGHLDVWTVCRTSRYLSTALPSLNFR